MSFPTPGEKASDVRYQEWHEHLIDKIEAYWAKRGYAPPLTLFIKREISENVRTHMYRTNYCIRSSEAWWGGYPPAWLRVKDI